jgi:hypothetical protein
VSNKIPNKRKTPTTLKQEGLVVDTDDEGSSSSNPLSLVTKRPDGRNKAKDIRTKGGDNVYNESLQKMEVKKELTYERRELRMKNI